MIGTVLVAGIFNNTTALGNAYGVCVMFVTFFDTCMVTLAAIFVWKISPFYVFLPWLTIALMDSAFLSSVLTKVPSGAWFTIMLAIILALILLEWRFGKEQQWAAEAADRFPTSYFVKKRRDGRLQLTERQGGTILSSINGLGIFFDKAGETTPLVFSAFISKLAAAPEVMIFFHMRALETPSVSDDQRYHVTRLGIPNCYRLVLRHGFNDRVITEDLARVIYEQVRAYIVQGPPPRGVQHATDDGSDVIDGVSTASLRASPIMHDASSTPGEDAKSIKAAPTSTTVPHLTQSEAEALRAQDLENLDRAFAHQVLYVIGKEEMRVKPGTNLVRKLLLKAFLWMRENSRTKVADLRVDTDRVVEVGFVKQV
jgi:KUP system potassium uptake protein